MSYAKALETISKTQAQMYKKALKSNQRAMTLIGSEKFTEAFQLLKQTYSQLNHLSTNPKDLQLLTITLNNLGCYYKRTGKPNVAMKYLNKALNLEKKHQIGNVSETYVNMCAIYSAMGKHDVALQYALEALDNFQKQAHENYTSLAIVYNNIGIEYEYLKRFRQAIQYFNEGFEIAQSELGEDHPLTLTLENNLKSIEQRMIKLDRFKFDRQNFRIATKVPLIPKQASTVQQKQTLNLPKRPSSQVRNTTPRVKVPSWLKPLGYRKEELQWLENAKRTLRYKDQVNQTVLGGDTRYISGDRLKPMFPDEANISTINNTHETIPEQNTSQRVIKSQGRRRSRRSFRAQSQQNRRRLEHIDPDQIAVNKQIPKDKQLEKVIKDSEKYHDPASKIQSIVRMFLAIRQLQKKKQAALKIQKNVRMHQVCVLYKRIHDSILHIQSSYRSYKNKKD